MQNNSSCKEKALATYNALKKRKEQKNRAKEGMFISTLSMSVSRCSRNRKKSGQKKYDYH